jgi:hypothetical protein
LGETGGLPVLPMVPVLALAEKLTGAQIKVMEAKTESIIIRIFILIRPIQSLTLSIADGVFLF